MSQRCLSLKLYVLLAGFLLAGFFIYFDLNHLRIMIIKTPLLPLGVAHTVDIMKTRHAFMRKLQNEIKLILLHGFQNNIKIWESCNTCLLYICKKNILFNSFFFFFYDTFRIIF